MKNTTPLKFTEYQISFSEIPEQISLSINISNCPHKCLNCHSPHLQQNIGQKLTTKKLLSILNLNQDITTITLLGGSQNINQINKLFKKIKSIHPNILTAIYLGDDNIPPHLNLNYVDYLKIGKYIPQNGNLANPNSNQILYQITHKNYNNYSLTPINPKLIPKNL